MKILRVVCTFGGFVLVALSLSAQTFTTLQTFNNGDGAFPIAPLIQATDGNLYGTTPLGGAYRAGSVFKTTPSGELTALYSFCSRSGCRDGATPNAGLVQASDGNFYGTTVEGGGVSSDGTVFQITPSGELTTLYTFQGDDGARPQAPLIQATDGNLYGTASTGGAHGYGTVFRITTSGKLTTLYSFCPQSGCADGTLPYAGLVQATDGNFYGTTAFAGNSNGGTVFEINRQGRLTTLHSFDGANSSGASGLIQASDGDLYGTTGFNAKGGGTVFKITLDGTLTTLYTFCSQPNCTDGAGAAGPLIQAADGNFYGITVGGGADDGGTIFDVTPSGDLTTLYSFSKADSYSPHAALIQDTNGSFYGTTEYGGAFPDCSPHPPIPKVPCGTVFSLSVGLGPFVETQTTSGQVGTSVNILGTDLTGASRVTFNGTVAVFTVVSSSEITATVPAGATTGPVQVVTPSGTLTSNQIFNVAW